MVLHPVACAPARPRTSPAPEANRNHLTRARHTAPGGLRGPTEESESGGSDLQLISGPSGWILFGALILTGGAIHHLVSGVGTVVKEVAHEAER